MPALRLLFLFTFTCYLYSCSVNKAAYSPLKKYDRKALEQDYTLLRNILEEKHPSVYWYTSKDSMDMYFTRYYQSIEDSMSEQQFAWKVLAPLVNKIKCGHTSVSFSKAYSNWLSKNQLPSFPLYMKVWNDSMLVMYNLNRQDSLLIKGTLVKSINGVSAQKLIDTIFDFLPQDGNAVSNNYIRMSSGFPYYHRSIFGLSKTYDVLYQDDTGAEKKATVPVFVPVKDTAEKDTSGTRMTRNRKPLTPRISRRHSERSLKLDSAGRYATIILNGFSSGRLRQFFRKSFRELREKKIESLILDIRYNGGGRVGLSTLLTKYLSRRPFKVADSLYAVSRNLSPYTRYVKGKFFNNIELFFITRKNKDGNYHIRHLEKTMFNPKRKNHFGGRVFVLTAGPTFSAAALFCNALKGQPGVTLVGEETGGGWYGNNGIMIPDIILPHTKLKVRLPLFRLVQANHIAGKGPGVVPDVLVETSYDALMKGYDKKMRVAVELVLQGATKPF